MIGAVRARTAPPVVVGRWRLPAAVLVLAVAALGFHLGAGAAPAAAAAVAAAVLVAGLPVAAPLADRVLPATARRVAARLGVPLPPREIALLGEVDTLVLPRAGVVTTGAPRLHGTTAAAGGSADRVRRLAAAVERAAEHPLAAAVVAAGDGAEQADDHSDDHSDDHDHSDGEPPGVADFDALPGRGVRGVVAELVGDRVVAHAVLVGSPAFLLDHGIALPAELESAREGAEAAGRVALAVAWDGVARGVLDVDDPVDPAAVAALAAARRAGLRPVVLTGAGPGVAAALAARLGADPGDVLAEPAPGAAGAVVRLMQAKGALVASAIPGGGGLDLPVPAGGAAGLVDAVRVARRARRVHAVVGPAASAAALLGAAAAAAGLLPPVLAPTVPVAGIALLAVGAATVAAFCPTGARGGAARTARAAPGRATCG